MSGDETTDQEGDKPRYAITNLFWRDPVIHAWFRTLDRLHLSTRFSSNRRARPGAFPHIRIRSKRSETYQPHQEGLPSNFYNPVYLEMLDDDQLDELKKTMQPELDLNLPANLIRYV